MPQQKTDGNAAETPGNEMSDRELLAYLAGQVEDLIELVRDRCDALSKQVDHVDTLAHQVDQKVATIHADLEKYRPLLEKYSALQRMFTPKPKGR